MKSESFGHVGSSIPVPKIQLDFVSFHISNMQDSLQTSTSNFYLTKEDTKVWKFKTYVTHRSV